MTRLKLGIVGGVTQAYWLSIPEEVPLNAVVVLEQERPLAAK